MEQNAFDALARGYLAFCLLHFPCCYVSQKSFTRKEMRRGVLFARTVSLARVFVFTLFAFYISQKESVVFHAGVLAFCRVPVCYVSVVLVSCCCFSGVVFLCLIFGGIRYCVDFPSALFCCLFFGVVFHCCFSCVFCLRCVVFPRFCL